MWSALRSLFSSPIGRIGGAKLKVWHVVAACAVVGPLAAGGKYAYIQVTQLTNSTAPQHVIVFISGLNTSLDNCTEDTFNETIQVPLVQQAGITNPYANGCQFGQDYHRSPTSMALYSYVGGQMDPQHGVYVPNNFDASNVNNLSVQTDVEGLDHMLDQYRQVFPQATFTIVGHSLGGLVALQGAYDYAVTLHHVGVINKVLTVDAPLAGALTGSQFDLWLHTFAAQHGIDTGTVETSDLLPLGQQSFISATCQQPLAYVTPLVVLSQCAANALIQIGVAVVTLGNDKDSLFCSQTAHLSDKTCSTQVLPPSTPALSVLYDETPLADESVVACCIKFMAPGHGTLLVEAPANQDIVRDIMAPVVTIMQPTAGETYRPSGGDVSVPFLATVHCLWGAAKQAVAEIIPPGRTTATQVGSSVPTGQADTLVLNGTATLTAPDTTSEGLFYVDASADADACQYPVGANSAALPGTGDYYGGLPRTGNYYFGNDGLTPGIYFLALGTPANAPTPTPTPQPTPTETPQPTPTDTPQPTPTNTPQPILTLAANPPTISGDYGGPYDCPVDSNYNYSCTVTLSETANSTGPLNWSVSTDLPNVSYSQSSGTLYPNNSIDILVTIPQDPADCYITDFVFSGGNSPLTVQWLC